MTGDLFGTITPATAPLSPSLVKGGALPSKQLEAYLTGRDLEPEPAIKSWAKLYIYQAACQIADMTTKERRQLALGKIPEPIAALVRDEVSRLWKLRR
jgi:hypothetical protein